MREDGRKRFAKEIKDRVEGLRDAVRSVKGELVGKGMCGHQESYMTAHLRILRWFDAYIRHYQTHTGHKGVT